MTDVIIGRYTVGFQCKELDCLSIFLLFVSSSFLGLAYRASFHAVNLPVSANYVFLQIVASGA